MPYTFGEGELEAYVPAARQYLKQLLAVTAAKSNSFLPQFEKAYRGPAAHAARLASIYAHKLLEQVAKGVQIDRMMPIPDLVRDPGAIVPVLKSVDSLGRLPLFAKALDECRIVLIIRHPCGMVSSKLRGHKLGKMSKPVAYRGWLKLASARERGLTADAIERFSPLQAVTHQWLLFNEYVVAELADDPRFHVLVYDDFCRDPHNAARDLLAWCGLEYVDATRRFIDQSLEYTGPQPRYFQIVRNPLEAANRWRSELSESEQREIAGLVGSARIGEYFYRDG